MKNKIEKYGVKKVHTRSQIQASGTQTGWRYRIVLLPCPSCLPSYAPQSVSAPGGQTGCPGHRCYPLL